MNFVTENILPVIASFLISVLLGPIVIPFLHKLKVGQTEREEGLRSHQKKTGTPTMGGVIFLIPVLMISLFYVGECPEIVAVLILTFGYGAIGFADDFIKVVLHRNLGLRAWQKLLAQFGVTGIFAVYLLNCTDITLAMQLPFTDKMLDFGWMNIPILFFIALGTANGTNFTDGVDGLCGSVTAVVAAFFAVAALHLGSSVSPVACSLLGALLGYLCYNVYPGKVMMGDTGSLAIGGFVTAIAYVLHLPIFIVIVGFIYALEDISVMLQVSYFKITHGKRIFKMAPIHHHFELCGWSETRVVNVFTTITILMALIAYAAML